MTSQVCPTITTTIKEVLRPFLQQPEKNFTPPEGYRGALPTLEPPWDAVEFAHVIPTEVIGVDGSQVYPDSAEPLPWAYAHAMVTSPSTRYLSRFFSPAELIQEKAASGRRLIDSVRFSLELELAAHVAWEHKDNAVVLLDGPVLPPGRTSHNREGLGRELLDKALLAMDEAVEQGVLWPALLLTDMPGTFPICSWPPLGRITRPGRCP